MTFCKKYYYYFILVYGIHISGCIGVIESGDMIKVINNSNETITMVQFDSIVSNERLRDRFTGEPIISDSDTTLTLMKVDIIKPDSYILGRARYGNNIKSNAPYFIYILNYDSLKSSINKDPSVIVDKALRKIIRVDYSEFEKTKGEFIYKGMGSTTQ